MRWATRMVVLGLLSTSAGAQAPAPAAPAAAPTPATAAAPTPAAPAKAAPPAAGAGKAAPGLADNLVLGGLGRLSVVRPAGAPTKVVLFLSGDSGWNAGSRALAQALAERGALVLGVDTPAYLEALGAGKKCGYPAGDLESLSQFAQKKLGLPEYIHPVLVGQGSGATLAYASLVEAPEATFSGVVTLAFSTELKMTGSLCKGSGLLRQRMKGGKGERVLPGKKLSAPWRALVGQTDKVFSPDKTRAFVANIPDAVVTEVPGVGHGFATVEGWKAALLQAEAELERISAPPPPVTATSTPEGTAIADVSDLPLIEVPTGKAEGDTLAVLLSGDGGWAGIDREVAAALVAAGVPVVGWDSLRYFWRKRLPEETAKDLERVLSHYVVAWKKPRVVLVGYSRGADVLPAVLGKLAPERRKAVEALALIAPSREAELEVHVMDLLGGGGGEPVLPAVKALGGLPVVCVYGSEEADDSLCTELGGVPGARSVKLEGGHHFGGDYESVGKAILAPLREGAKP